MKIIRLVLLISATALVCGFSSDSQMSRMKADYVEACSCHSFCPCYFNKHAEMPMCEFNMAVKVKEGRSGSTDLANAKYWITGDLGDEWGTAGKGSWVMVSFDPATTKAQRDALVPIILQTYGLKWNELKSQEAPVEITRSGDIVEAKLGDGSMAHMKLQRVAGTDGKTVVINNLKYFGAQKNDGFEVYKSIDHSANVGGHKFQYADRNAFLISIEREQPLETTTAKK
jgi:hypothetical protein